MAEGTPNGLTSKVGPLPAWAWGAVVVVVVLYLRHRNNLAAQAQAEAAAAADPSAQDTGTTDSTNLDTFGGAGFQGGVGQANDPYATMDPTDPAFPVGSIAHGVPAPITNAQWAKLAGNYLIGHGDDPILVTTALARYLAGASLTVAQQAVVSIALQTFGTPPEGVKAITPAPGSPVPTTPGAPKLSGESTADHKVHLSWTHPGGANVFLVTRDGHIVGTTGKTVWTTMVLRKGSAHTFRVTPVGTHTGKPSNIVRVTVR